MTAEERWKRVQALCEQIEGLPAGEREGALAAAEPDAEVRRDVWAMLQALVGEEVARRDAWRESAPATLPGRIGEYTVTGLLGQGGTSTVYAAERAGQPVAVKVLHSYFHEPEQVERFQRERGILTRLDHPGICRVLDAGLTADERPYLVLERVDGRPIDEYCNAYSLGLEQRIRLVMEACEAVGAAHRSLIVHLDLKPGNMLVTTGGRVRVLDFGTAKLLDTEGALTTTRHLTPLYASPEQLRGEPVTTACDVYGLGMVLYELLAGAGPFRAASIVAVAERAAGHAATARMAERVTAEAARERGVPLDRLRRELSGDIETIVAKALAAEPGQRYGSALELGADLRRYVEGRPVLARKQTVAYRLRKYAGRNRGAVAVTALLAMGLAGALGYGAWQQMRALEEARRAATVGRFLQWMIASSNPTYTGRANMTVLELVGRAEKSLERGELADAEITADLEASLADMLFQGGKPAEGAAVARRAYERARGTGNRAVMLAATQMLGTTRLNEGDCAGSERLYQEGDGLFALERRALPLWRQAGYLVSRDQVLATCGGDRSGKLTEEAAELARRIPTASKEGAVPMPIFKGLILNGLIRVQTRNKKFAEALATSEEALRMVAEDPNGRTTRVALLQSRAAAEYLMGDKQGAAKSLEEAVVLAEGYSAPFEAIRLHVMAGQRVAEAGRPERALELADRAMAMADAHREELAATRWMVLIDAAITYQRAGRCERVGALVREADALTGGRMPPQWKGNRLATEAFCLTGAAARARAREAIAVGVWAPGTTFRKRLDEVAGAPQ